MDEHQVGSHSRGQAVDASSCFLDHPSLDLAQDWPSATRTKVREHDAKVQPLIMGEFHGCTIVRPLGRPLSAARARDHT